MTIFLVNPRDAKVSQHESHSSSNLFLKQRCKRRAVALCGGVESSAPGETQRGGVRVRLGSPASLASVLPACWVTHRSKGTTSARHASRLLLETQAIGAAHLLSPERRRVAGTPVQHSRGEHMPERRDSWPGPPDLLLCTPQTPTPPRPRVGVVRRRSRVSARGKTENETTVEREECPRVPRLHSLPPRRVW